MGPSGDRPNPFWSERAQDTFSLQQARPRDLPQLETAEGGEGPASDIVVRASETASGAVGLEDDRDSRAAIGLPNTGTEEDHAIVVQASESSVAAHKGKPSLEDVRLSQQRAAEEPISDEWASEGGNTNSVAHGDSSGDGTPRDAARTPEELRWLVKGLYEGMQRTSSEVQRLSTQMANLQGQVADQVIEMKGHLQSEMSGLTYRLERLEHKSSSAGSMHSALELAGVDHADGSGVSLGMNAGDASSVWFGGLGGDPSVAAPQGWPSERPCSVRGSPDVQEARVEGEKVWEDLPKPPKADPPNAAVGSHEGEEMKGLSGVVPVRMGGRVVRGMWSSTGELVLLDRPPTPPPRPPASTPPPTPPKNPPPPPIETVVPNPMQHGTNTVPHEHVESVQSGAPERVDSHVPSSAVDAGRDSLFASSRVHVLREGAAETSSDHRVFGPGGRDPFAVGDRVMWDLPVLGPVSETNPALRASDWLYKIKPLMADLSSGSAYWWDSVVSEAQKAYDRYASSSSTLRGSIVGELSGELGDPRYTRLEARALAMLSKAVPDSVYQQALASRSLSTVGLLFQVLKSFQPGGLLERQSLLKGLGELSVAATAHQGVETLQTWFRWLARARSMSGVQVPDCSILLAALDNAGKTLLSSNPQVAFRCSVYRNMHNLDRNPTLAGVEEYGKQMLAEFEDLSVNVDATESPKRKNPKLNKVTEDKGGKGGKSSGKDESTGKGAKLCWGWSKPEGCKHGNTCTFKHDAEKSGSHCYNCGAEDHYKNACTRPGGGAKKSETQEASEGDSQKGAGKGDKRKKGGKKGSPQKPQVNKTVIEEETPPAPTNGGDPSASAPADIVADVSQLLKSMRLAALRTGQPEYFDISDEQDGESADGPTLESFTEEPGEVEVSSAPKGDAADDYDRWFEWDAFEACTRDSVDLQSLHGDGEPSIRLKRLSNSCEGTAFALVDGGATNGLRNEAWKGEAQLLSQVKVSLAVGHTTLGMTDAGVLVSPTPTQVILPMRYLHELGYGMSWKNDGYRIWRGGESLKVKLEDGCPTIPETRALQLMCEFEQLTKTKTLRLRSLKATCKQPVVEKPVEWLSERVQEKGADLPVEDLVRFLCSWAPNIPEEVVLSSVAALDSEGLKTPWNHKARRSHARGKLVIHLFGGFQRDTKQAWGGNLVLSVAKEGGHNFRKPGVLGYLYALAAGGKVDGIVGSPPCIHVSEREAVHAFDDTCVLVQTALLVMLAHVSKREGVSDESREGSVFVALENTRSPDEHMWKVLQKTLGLRKAMFDQGALGHDAVKPTCMLTGSWKLYSFLHGKHVPKDIRWPSEHRESVEGPIAQSRVGAMCPNLVDAIRDSFRCWVKSSIVERERESEEMAAVKVLSKQKKDMWHKHLMNDHVPFRRDCPVCVASAARSKPHRRQSCPKTQVLSIDIAGPFVSGVDLFNNASQRYALVASLTLPGGEEQQDKDTDAHDDDNGFLDCNPGGNEGNGEDPSPSTPNDLFGDEDEEEVKDEAVPAAPAAELKDDEETQEKESDPTEPLESLPVRTLRFAIPMKSRQHEEVRYHLMSLVARLKALGLHVARVHSDRARELISPKLKTFLYEHAIDVSHTSGESPQQNGRAENTVGWAKSRARALLQAAKLENKFWPLAMRHATERDLRMQLASMGTPQQSLLPWATTVQAKVRSWKAAEAPGNKPVWTAKTVEGRALGVAPSTTDGYVVLLPDESLVVTGTVFPMTTPGSDTPKPKYKLQGKTPMEQISLRKTWVTATYSAGRGESHRQMQNESSNEQDSPPAALKDPPKQHVAGCELCEHVSHVACGMCESRVESSDSTCHVCGLKLPPAPRTSRTMEELEQDAQDLFEEEWHESTAKELVEELAHVGFPTIRSDGKRGSTDGSYAVFGMFVHGGVVGITSMTKRFSNLARLLAWYVHSHFPEETFTSIMVSSGVVMPVHQDKYNLVGSNNLLLRLSERMPDDGVWVECKDGGELMGKEWELEGRKGQILEIPPQGLKLDPRSRHATSPLAHRASRKVLVGYTLTAHPKLSEAQRLELTELGFTLPESVCSLKSVSASGVTDQKEVLVELPEPVVEEGFFEEVVQRHWRLSQTLLEWKREILPTDAGEVDQVVLRACSDVMQTLADLEELACSIQPDSEKTTTGLSLKSLGEVTYLNGESLDPSEAFLQTRIVSQSEVLDELDLWLESIRSEYRSLTEESGAVEPTTAEAVEKLVKDGLVDQVLPVKPVMVRKQGSGKRK